MKKIKAVGAVHTFGVNYWLVNVITYGEHGTYTKKKDAIAKIKELMDVTHHTSAGNGWKVIKYDIVNVPISFAPKK
jgi:hypothetical protein